MLTRRGGTGRGELRARADLGGPRAEAGWDWETVGFFRGLIPERLSSHRATSRPSSMSAASSRGNPIALAPEGRIRSPPWAVTMSPRSAKTAIGRGARFRRAL